jgi:DNA-binding IclR family transcriptional regulator
VSGSIQSVERAAAVLRILGAAGRPLPLSEIALALDLPKATAFGLVRTLRDVGFVQQERVAGGYSLADGIGNLHRSGLDPHDLRSHAMNWADALASRTRLEVHIGVPDAEGARLVHHVFRPDDSAQTLRIDEIMPFHATALGKIMLGFAAGTPNSTGELTRYTPRTLTSRAALDAHMHGVRQRGWADENAELHADIGAVAAPLRGYGGLGVGGIAVVGPVERVFRHAGPALEAVVSATVDAAAAISRSLGHQP